MNREHSLKKLLGAAPRSAAGAAREGRAGLRLALYLGALLLLGSLAPELPPAVRGGDGPAALNGAGWEGRRLVAQLLWAKTHAVLHAGMEERAARPGEARTRSEFHSHSGESPAEHAEHEGHDEHEEEGHVLVIPPAREDFRGILGDLERAVKPYLGADGKMYEKDADQTVPFYRLMTWADPHFIQGYTVGATFLCRAGEYTDRALEFLREGERYNPESPEIQTELGHFYVVYKKDYARAERHLRRALQLFARAQKLDELQKDALIDAHRWLALGYVEWGKPREAVAVARAGLRVEPQDPTFRHVLQFHGRNWTRDDLKQREGAGQR